MRGAAIVLCGWAAVAFGDVGRPAKVFVGREGLTVAVVPLKAGGEVLVEVDGAGSLLDGKVVLHSVEESGDRTDYQTELRGRSFYTLRRRGGEVYLNLPDHGDSIPLKYDEAKSRALAVDAVSQRYQQQVRDGTLAQLARFDRKREQAEQEKRLAQVTERMRHACGGGAAVRVAWDSFDDDAVKHLSIESYCGAAAEAMARMCASDAAKQLLAAKVKGIECRLGHELKCELSPAGTFVWTSAREGANFEEFVTGWLEQNLTPAGSATVDQPWGTGQSLRERMALEKTAVCAGDKGHFVVVAPHPRATVQLWDGDGKKFARVPLPEGMLGGEDFLDPRYFRKGSNPSFRGMDMRIYSHLEVDRAKQTCTLRCGENEHTLRLLPAAEARAMVLAASFGAPLQRYRPYALLRDDRGRYYLVDRGTLPGEEKRFRLFLGVKGALKEQKMTNVVSDSEGDVFSTRTGSLRLIIDKTQPPLWIQGGKKLQLKQVPVGENLTMIYNELGVYLGQRLGTPCDDF